MMRRFLPAVAACVLGACVLGACVDTTPGEFTPGPEAGVDPLLVVACRNCIAGDGAPCRSIFDQCAALQTCPPALGCLIDNGCFTFPTLEERLACGSPCVE